ncbi:MAG: hypothetical protein ACFB4I_25055 [Cyanophyceae cyanobacterium]
MKTAKNLTRNSQAWTTEQLIGLSESLGHGYCPGLNRTHNLHGCSQGWNAQKLIKLSESLGHAYYPGL